MIAAMTARVDVFRIPTRIPFGRGVALTVAEPLREIGREGGAPRTATAADIAALYRAAL